MAFLGSAESLNKVFLRLREIAPEAGGGITQPKKSLFEVLCIIPFQVLILVKNRFEHAEWVFL